MPFKPINSNTIEKLNELGRKKFGTEYDPVYSDVVLKYSISESLANARTESGKTQKELAEALHKNQQKISEYERGVKTPTVLSLIEIARALNCKFVIDPEDEIQPLQFTCTSR